MSVDDLSTRPLAEIQQIFVKAIERMTGQATHSVRGAQPDQMGQYPKSHGGDKERLEILYEILNRSPLLHLSEKDLGRRFGSLEDFLQAFSVEIQAYNESVFGPICHFMESEFGFKVQYLDRNEIRFNNRLNTLQQLLTLSRDEIAEKLHRGSLSPEEEEKIIQKELIPQFKRDQFKF